MALRKDGFFFKTPVAVTIWSNMTPLPFSQVTGGIQVVLDPVQNAMNGNSVSIASGHRHTSFLFTAGLS